MMGGLETDENDNGNYYRYNNVSLKKETDFYVSTLVYTYSYRHRHFHNKCLLLKC